MAKKTPLRKCIGCGSMHTKKEMIRVIKTPENEIKIDGTGKMNGRGAYICHSTDCLSLSLKNRGLERSLKMKIPEEIYDRLAKELSSCESE